MSRLLTLADVAAPIEHKSRHLALVGHRSRRLVVAAVLGYTAAKDVLCSCDCDCGATGLIVSRRSILSAQRKPICCERATTKGEHAIWRAIQDRCNNPSSYAYGFYGALGVKMCGGWSSDFWSFYGDMGPRPAGRSIDRVNVTCGYWCGHCDECKSRNRHANCRWATASEQANNRRVTVRVEWKGRTVPIKEVADELGLNQTSLCARYQHCKSLQLAIEREQHKDDLPKCAQSKPVKTRRGVTLADIVLPLGTTYPNMVNETYGRLTVRKMLGRVKCRHVVIECDCSCGTTGILLLAPNVRTSHTTSCGCLALELKLSRSTTHGKASRAANGGRLSPEYVAWQAMIQRCHNPKDPRFPSYGAKGVVVDPTWRDDFSRFLSDMGPKPQSSLSLDRIDVAGPYSALNCRWADAKTQQNNRSDNVYVEHEGKKTALTPLCERLGLDAKLIAGRLRRKVPFERAVLEAEIGRMKTNRAVV